MMKFFLMIIFSIALLALSACENYQGTVIDTKGSQCPSGAAEIGVGDGFLEYLCGCTGAPAAGTILSQPATIVCHVPAGTYVMFQYIDIHLTHQIVSSGGNSFVSGEPIMPGGGVYTTTAQFNATGTYDFEDAYNLALQGQIIVP